MAETCIECGEMFDASDSVGSDFQLCQNCWELDCDKAWWEMAVQLPVTEDRDE